MENTSARSSLMEGGLFMAACRSLQNVGAVRSIRQRSNDISPIRNFLVGFLLAQCGESMLDLGHGRFIGIRNAPGFANFLKLVNIGSEIINRCGQRGAIFIGSS